MAESSNSQNNNQTELTMCDVLEEEQELEDDANAVLGGSDDTNCSYEKGYVSRQALYACTTCSSGQEPSGVCLACSYKCHDGHEIVELYTKRNFRCDCGNSKFAGKTCSLKPDKDPVNNRNKYNQNFKGLYCSCSRPYPDLEDDTPDEMIQCVICEDWYHGRHIGSIVPDDYFEMICSKCMESHKFLYSYLNKFQYVNVNDDNCEDSEKCNGTLKTSNEEKTSSVQPQIKSEHIKKERSDTQVASDQPDQTQSPVEGRNVNVNDDNCEDSEKCNGTLKRSDEDKTSSVQPQVKSEHIKKERSDTQVASDQPDQTQSPVEGSTALVRDEIIKSEQEAAVKQENTDCCLLNKLTIKPDGITSGPAFWPENWRKELCQCTSCMAMYRKLDCEYILNIDDTILAYEERGKSTTESQYDRGLNALSKLDRVKQMEAIRAYTSMKGQLKEYLKDFATSKRTVCESDIKEFFERIGKRQRLNNGVPHFCR